VTYQKSINNSISLDFSIIYYSYIQRYTFLMHLPGLCIHLGYSFASMTKNVTVPRRKKPGKRALYRDIPPVGLHFHCVKKGVFLLARLTFLMLCRLSGGRFLAGTFRRPASQIISALRSMELAFDIEDYVWRLCINYIALNRVTKVIGYPIPCCDFAAMISMGGGKFRWLLDAPQGFHQIGVDKASQEKLAFAGPYTRKYTYKVMPFGPVNGPVTFVHL
jgi:hypothetical protein